MGPLLRYRPPGRPKWTDPEARCGAGAAIPDPRSIGPVEETIRVGAASPREAEKKMLMPTLAIE